MRNSLTSRYKKKEQVKYYTDINLENKKWEVIELPTRKVVERYQFEEDAESYLSQFEQEQTVW